MPRILIYIIAIPLVLIIAAAILLPLLLDKDKILELAATQVKQQTGATLRVEGDSSISLFPALGVGLGQVSLEMPDVEQGKIQARSLQIGVQFMPLLSGEVAIDTIALDGVTARVVTTPDPDPIDTTGMSDEQLQAFYAKRQAEREQAGKTAGTEAAVAVPLALEVASLSITDSRIEMAEVGGDTTVIEILKLHGKGLNLDDRPMPLEAVIRMPGDTPMQVSLQGTLKLSQATQRLRIDNLDVKITGALAETISVATSGEVDISRQVADLQLQADIADTHAQGQLRYASFESPQIDANLHLNRFTPALIALAGPDAGAASSNTSAPEGDEDTPLPLDALRVMDTRAKLRIDEVLWDGHRVTDLKANLRVVKGAAILPSVTGNVHGGQLQMKANLNAKHSLAKLNTQGSLSAVDISQALAAAELEPMMSGKASLDWKLHGEGNTSGALTNTLRGPISLQTEAAVLLGMGVEKMLCEAVALVNQESLSAEFPANSPFEALSVEIMMGEGKATLQPLRAKLADVRLLGKGAMDLNTLDFDTTFTAKLLPGLGELDPACRVNERISAIDWPLACKGNVAGEPGDWCSVDSGEILGDMAEYELKRKAQKKVEEKLGEEAGDALKKLFGK
jgi:uncharacterized protein involved in outer membrane biogenesis